VADESVSPPSKVQRVNQIDAALNSIDDIAKETPGPLTGKRSTKQAAPNAKEAVPPPPARKSPRIERIATNLQGQREFENLIKKAARDKLKEGKLRIQLNGRPGCPILETWIK